MASAVLCGTALPGGPGKQKSILDLVAHQAMPAHIATNCAIQSPKNQDMAAPPSSRRVLPVLMDELVEEILIRFPPDDPASLLSAALVCKAWCRLVFRRRFREYHRTPPLLGFLSRFGNSGPFELHYLAGGAARFVPAMTTTFRRLPHRAAIAPSWHAVDALHGRILFYDPDTVTGESTELDLFVLNPMVAAEVLRLPTLEPSDVFTWSAGLLDGPFRVVVVSMKRSTGTVSAYVYSSEQHTWTMQTTVQIPRSNVILMVPKNHSARIRNNALYFLTDNPMSCVEYHMGRQELTVISLPS